MVLAPLVGYRVPRRSLFVVVNLVTAALLAPLLTVTGEDRLWLVYAVSAGYGLSHIAASAIVTALVQGLRLARPLLGAGLSSEAVPQGNVEWGLSRVAPG